MLGSKCESIPPAMAHNNHMHPTSLRSWVCVCLEAARALVCEGVLLALLGG